MRKFLVITAATLAIAAATLAGAASAGKQSHSVVALMPTAIEYAVMT